MADDYKYENEEFPEQYESDEPTGTDFSTTTDDTKLNAQAVTVTQDYNGVTIDNDNGITVLSLLNTLLMNASAGITITRNSDGAVMLSLDSSGNAVFAGTLNGATGSFVGNMATGDDVIMTGTTPAVSASNGALAVRSVNDSLYLQAAHGARVNCTEPALPSTYVDFAANSITAYGNLVAQGSVSFSPPTFTNALLLNGFTTNNSRTVRFTKVGTTVYVEGEVAYKVGTVFNLPAAYRPAAYALNLITTQTTGTGAYKNIISVGTNGDVQVLASDSASFGVALNFSFIAEQ